MIRALHTRHDANTGFLEDTILTFNVAARALLWRFRQDPPRTFLAEQETYASSFALHIASEVSQERSLLAGREGASLTVWYRGPSESTKEDGWRVWSGCSDREQDKRNLTTPT